MNARWRGRCEGEAVKRHKHRIKASVRMVLAGIFISVLSRPFARRTVFFVSRGVAMACIAAGDSNILTDSP